MQDKAHAPYPAYVLSFCKPDMQSVIRQTMPSTAEFAQDERSIN